ncbi:butyrophilin subfamily 3 member A2-like [Betta splendens]|uniref:Butyrophilin subfamily 3 member A2-like n=1 Tax=Betta splendens TaxID=158456 RepID=A0A9W2XBG8_BETSP|nr:butyrophilin subfamily 3 member A2-like [Betta splendens]
MGHTENGPDLKPLLRTISALTSWPFVVLLLLILCIGGQSQEADPPPVVVVTVGEDAVLPCKLQLPVDAAKLTVEWGRPDLTPRFVYVWHNGQELEVDQNKGFTGRASASDGLKQGDASLTLSRVRISDSGTYRCYVPSHSVEELVELVVGSFSSPVVSLSGLDRDRGGVTLACASADWFPEPELLWLDAEGKLLSAGPTETVRGSDDLYTVSSRVTVDKRHSSRYTCRVQQTSINHTSEAHIEVPDDFFMTPSSCAAATTLSVVFGLMFVTVVIFSVWKWRRDKSSKLKTFIFFLTKQEEDESKERNSSTEHQPLMEAINMMEHLDKKKTKLNEEVKEKEEELDDLMQSLDALKEVKEELDRQREQLITETLELEKITEEAEKKVKSVDKDVTEKNGDKTQNRAQGYLKLKEIMIEVSWKLKERKKDQQQLNMNMEKIHKRTIDEFNRITEKKNEVEKNMKQMKEQLQETETQREETQKKLLSGRKQEGNKIKELNYVENNIT